MLLEPFLEQDVYVRRRKLKAWSIDKAKRWIAAAAASVLLVGSCAAQDASGGIPDMLEALRHGPLTVWVIGPPNPPRTPVLSNYSAKPDTPITYKEQTSGSFGQSASTYGQNAGSYGLPSDTATISTPKSAPGDVAPPPRADGTGYKQQTSGSFGQTSSTYGTTASNNGQTAGSFGTNASNHGQTAGSFGQTAGSFGNSLSTVATAGSTVQKAPPSKLQSDFSTTLLGAFPELQVRFADVAADELTARLMAAEGTANYPDALVGVLPDSWGEDARGHFVMETIRPEGVYNDGLGDGGATAVGAVLVMLRPPHRPAAKALAVWAGEAGSGCAGCLADGAAQPPYAAVAAGGISRLMQGVAVGELADPEMAGFAPLLGRVMLTTVSNSIADDGSAKVQVVRATKNGRLAAVSLRVVVGTDKVFGVAHPLVVLRQTDDGKWKVLHVSLNLPAIDEERARAALMRTTPNADAETKAGVIGVKLGSPADGETRPTTPELTWDNGGGAGLQVVEWQMNLSQGGSDRWSDARLFLTTDQGSRLTTQVTAGFAIHQAKYRWRVWSVGSAGAVKISGWRVLNIVP